MGVKEPGVNHVCDQVQKVDCCFEMVADCKGLRPKPWIGALSKTFYVGTDKSPDAWQMYTRD